MRYVLLGYRSKLGFYAYAGLVSFIEFFDAFEGLSERKHSFVERFDLFRRMFCANSVYKRKIVAIVELYFCSIGQCLVNSLPFFVLQVQMIDSMDILVVNGVGVRSDDVL